MGYEAGEQRNQREIFMPNLNEQNTAYQQARLWTLLWTGLKWAGKALKRLCLHGQGVRVMIHMTC
jgi:hypothetical protein